MSVTDNDRWFINGNYEFACVRQEEGTVILMDQEENILFKGNL